MPPGRVSATNQCAAGSDRRRALVRPYLLHGRCELLRPQNCGEEFVSTGQPPLEGALRCLQLLRQILHPPRA